MAIVRKAVVSSQILSVGYDEPTKVLEVEFTPSFKTPDAPGSVYQYENVDKELAEGFFVEKEPDGSKRSVGRYFATVKKNPEKYPYKKISPVK